MAAALCTVEEIAGYFGINAGTFRKPNLKDRFQAVLSRRAAATKLEVRERQIQLAVSGNPVGSIWWGKQHLGQADRQEHTGRDGGPIEIAESKARLAEVLEALKRRREASEPA